MDQLSYDLRAVVLSEGKLVDFIEGETIGEKTHQLLQYREKRIKELEKEVWHWSYFREKLLKGASLDDLQHFYENYLS